MNQKKAIQRYQLELFGAMMIYGLILFTSIQIGQSMTEGIPRTLLCLSPMLGFLLALWAIARFIHNMDEYLRQSTLENITIAAGITLGATFTYGFLEGIGYPRLSMFVVWGTMGLAFALTAMVRGRWRIKP